MKLCTFSRFASLLHIIICFLTLKCILLRALIASPSRREHVVYILQENVYAYLDKLSTLGLDGMNGISPIVQERRGHHWLVSALDASWKLPNY